MASLLDSWYDPAARLEELCDRVVADIRHSSPMTVAIRGKGSKIRYLPVMDCRSCGSVHRPPRSDLRLRSALLETTMEDRVRYSEHDLPPKREHPAQRRVITNVCCPPSLAP